MNSIRVLALAGVSLAAFSVGRAGSAAPDWIAHYYQNPRPGDFLQAVYALDRGGYFNTAGQPDIAIGFFSGVFAENPNQVSDWLSQSGTFLSERAQRILAAAAWKAGSPAGARRMVALSARDAAGSRDAVAQAVASGTLPVPSTPVESIASMNLQWGAYLATGDRRCVENILVALGSDRPGLATSARFALAQNAAADPRVFQICRDELSRQPEAIRSQIEAALNEAATVRPGA